MKKIALLFALLLPAAGFAQTLSIGWTALAGGGGTSSNGALMMIDTIGQAGAGGPMTNGSFVMTGGFWALEAAPVGSLQVTIEPAGAVRAGAEWEVDGAGPYTNGEIVNSLIVGSHTVAFLPVNGWLTPSNLTVTVNTNQTTITNEIYVLTLEGSLQVTITPTNAVTNGAQWQVDGGTNQISGATVSNLIVGTHLVSLRPVFGWTPPPDEYVTITNGATTMVSNVYTSTTEPTTALVLVTNGSGAIHYPKTVVIGNKYTVTAVPKARNVFVNWTGGASSPYSVLTNSASYTFFMQSNLLLQANFVTNVFLAAQGAYYGLFAPADSEREQANSGSFNFNLTSTGSVSGDLHLGSQTVPLSGKFGVDGSAVIPSKRHGQSTLTTSLQVDLAGQTVAGMVTDGTFVAQLTGYQNVFGAHNKTAYARRYTLIIPGTTNPAVGPYGTSYGTVLVGPSGNISFAGSLADGTAVSQSSVVSEEGLWPFYLSLYGGHGSFWSWNYFTNGTITSLPYASWINAINSSRTADYRSGFTNQDVTITGFSYVGTAQPLLNLTSGEVILEGGGLSAAITNQIALLPNNKITFTSTTEDTNNLTLMITKTTGAISGSFHNPSNPRQTIKVNGVLLQGQTNAQGYFLGPTQSGTFELVPQ